MQFEKISEIPYFDKEEIKTRAAPSLSFYDKGQWHVWLHDPNKGCLKIHIKDVIEFGYFGSTSAGESHLSLPFLDFVVQRAITKETSRYIPGITSDLQNFGATLAKLRILHFYGLSTGKNVTRPVVTEIEYLFGLARSFFDLLQETIAGIWSTVRFRDPNLKKKNLKKSFSDIVLFDNKLLTAAEIAERHYLPMRLAEFYAKQAPFYQRIKAYRESVYHFGASPELIFQTEKGFAVKSDQPPFAALISWPFDHALPNDLNSLHFAFAKIIDCTIQACNDMAAAFLETIQFPPPIAPGFDYYLAGRHISEISSIENSIHKSPWPEPQI
tara:strand:- start:165 stop:1145 length:981 start_codon:yes stop_codon:yes gene_type:complete